MSKLSRFFSAKNSIAHRCVALCAALTLALSPANAMAFAETGASDGSGGSTVSESAKGSDLARVGDVSGSQSGSAEFLGSADADGSGDAGASLLDEALAGGVVVGSGASNASRDALENLEVGLKWLNVPDSQKHDLSWSDQVNLTNPTQTVTYRLSISSSNVGYAAGKLVVRVPQSLWTDRFGTAITPKALGIPQAPNTGSATIPFNYSVDATAGELVITNTASVPAASNYEIDVQYSVTPWNTIDGSLAKIKAIATGTATNGAVNQATSNTITYTVDTDVRTDNVLKTDGKPMYYWDAAYTGDKPQPADFSDYRWVSWRVVMGGAANQPYSVTLRDVPGQGGEVYAVADGDLYYHDLKGSDFTLNPDGTITSKVFYDNTVRGPASEPIPANGEGNCIRVLVRYPKTGGDVLTNAIESSLQGVDTRVPHITSSNASMDWKDFEFTYDGEPLSMVKFADAYNETPSKTIDSMLALLQRGEDVSLTWGMRTTANIYAGVNYLGNAFHGEMVDDVTYWAPQQNATTPAQAKTLMTKDDFQYQSAKIYVTAYHIDRSNGQKIYFDQNAPNAPKITVWGMNNEASGFQEVGSFSASELSYEGASGNLYKEFNFPLDTYRVKVTFSDTEDHLYLRMDPTVQLKASSPTLQSWFAEAAATGSTLSALRVQNFNYYQLYSENNIPLHQNWTGDYRFDPAYVDNAFLADQDKAQYGKLLARSSAGITVTNLVGASETLKYASKPINDSSEQAVHMDYWLHGRDWYNMTVDDYAALRDAGWPAPARDEAQFYDLLPVGMVYDGRQYPVVYDVLGRSYTSNLDVQLVDNFRGTGRQMVVFTITSKTPGTNVTSSTEIWRPQLNADGTIELVLVGYQPPSQAGYTVKFRATVPWNKLLFTNKDTNLAAYQVPESDPLRGGGHADNGVAPIVQDVVGSDGRPVFADLRGNGINENILDTKYMTQTTAIDVPIALGSGLVKQVREDASILPFTREARTAPAGGYTYRLTADTDSISQMKDLVLFDILEEAQNTDGGSGEVSWQGMIDSVDASDAHILGIEPQVYYSTSPTLSYGNLDVDSLDDVAIWTDQEPFDHSTITAVAVDLRYRADGSEYVFEPSTGVSVLVHMKAPGMLPLEEFAFNRAAYYSTLLDPFGGEKTELNLGDRTMVSIADTPLFTKASDPLGGSNANNATTVQPGQEITYTLTFDPVRVNSKRIVVKDVVPAGMNLVPGSITYTPVGASTPQQISDAAFDAVTSILTWPTYDQATTGAAKFQFKATVQPLENGSAYRLYENKASVTIGDEAPLDSNAITHQQLNRWAEVSKAAALVDGITSSDPDAAHSGTVLGESNGTADAPVPTALSQVVEYHLVVKNVGAKQTSGQIDVADMVPAGATYVPGSATATFRSSEHPEGPAAGSIATVLIQEPTADNARVLWKLDKLSDGEEAYLTFRVGAPATAFTPDQTGMWAEKTFENTAQMIDGAKGETKTTQTTYHRVQEARLTVVKQWDDAADQEGLRPQSILAQLLADGVAMGDPVTLDASNGWTHAWAGLATTNAGTGQNIVYAAVETKTVCGYEAPVYMVDPANASLMTITNKRIPGTPLFEKFSDPAGGWSADSAAKVSAGQEIAYRLTFDPMRGNAQNIVVRDFVPAGLDLVPGSITFAPAGATTPQPVNDDAYQAASGELVWPAYDQEDPGVATFQFKVRVHTLDNATMYRLYENKASATMGENPPIESNVITHQQLNRWADVSKTAALVEGVAPSDPDAAHGGTVQDENSGTQDAAVNANLNQIVEYHLVVKNTGINQTSGQIQVMDIIPAATNYITGSATVVFRSSVDPANPVAGTTATGSIQEPTADSPQVLWTLDKLSDGEEAYLTFRVSAPVTAFDEDQVGMWAQKTFENTALMTDVIKGETKQTETTHHKVQEARITVAKQWDDANNYEGLRPQSISAQLYADGFAFGAPVALNETNGWTYAWTGLAATRAETSERVHYTVEETQAVAGYEAPVYTVDSQDASLTTIVNKRVPGTPALIKASDPVGGSSSADAATVQSGQEITYTLSFDPARANAKNVVVKDFVPAGLDLVPGSITFTPAGWSTAQTVSDSAYNTTTRELTWPMYNQVPTGAATFQFKATAQTLTSGETYRLYENRASATIGDESPFESNVITHQQLNRWADVSKTAALVEGITSTDPDVAHGGTVSEEQRGSMDAPVNTGLAQIFEYHLVVTNFGAKQTSGQIDVADMVPAGTVFVPGSATLSFRSSAHPENSLPGSVASGAVQEPTAGSAQVLWQLYKLSDGEEAFLTFRVSAPKTAFSPGQTGMWAEKMFENSAQMTDVAREETKQTETTYHAVQEARLTVEKQWDDVDNQEGLRPPSVLVQLLADGVPMGELITLNAEGAWKYEWTGLTARQASTGQPIIYSVAETKPVSGYEAPVYLTNPDDASRISIVNKRVPGTPLFEKMSNPTGGWSADSAVNVQAGQEITYTLSFDPMKGNTKDIVVKDTVPEGLDIVPGSITFTPAGSTVPQSIGDEAYQEATRLLVWPTYQQELPGAATFHFKAWVHPLATGETYRLYENKASASMDENPPIESNVITHQQLNRWADVAKTAALVEGVTPSDPDAAYAGTVQSEERGTQAAPVSTGLAQIVEYHLVVKNTGAGQTSGQIEVRDVIPVETTYIPNSATMTFRSTAHPEDPVAGSLASGAIEQPATASPQIRWLLDKLSDGEEAYLTFRVSAPMTAFTPSQIGMWAEKSFVNVAQMTDLVKGETKQTETTHHKVQEARITAHKQWADTENKDGMRPQSIMAQLYADGVALGEPVVLNERNGWAHSWVALAAVDAETGEHIVYTVKETQTVAGYHDPAYFIDPGDASQVTIVNTHMSQTPEPPTPTTPTIPTSSRGYASSAKPVATGDLIPLGLVGFAGVGVVASAAVVAYAVHRRRRNS